MTPTLLHLWWHERPAPRAVAAIADAWRALHPAWDVRLWTDEAELAGPRALAPPGVPQVDLVRHVANVVRWRLLADYGGVWVDCDTHPLRPLDPLLGDRPFSAGAGDMPTPFVIGGPAGHELWLDALRASTTDPTGPSPVASGGRMLARFARNGRLDIIPCNQFADHDAAGTPLPAPPDGRYCTHDWTTSRTRHQDRRTP